MSIFQVYTYPEKKIFGQPRRRERHTLTFVVNRFSFFDLNLEIANKWKSAILKPKSSLPGTPTRPLVCVGEGVQKSAKCVRDCQKCLWYDIVWCDNGVSCSVLKKIEIGCLTLFPCFNLTALRGFYSGSIFSRGPMPRPSQPFWRQRQSIKRIHRTSGARPS